MEGAVLFCYISLFPDLRHIEKNAHIKSLLDKYGYSDHKGASFAAAVMSVSQDGPVDMLMYYDARPRVAYNGLFDHYTQAPMPQYYALYAWKNLVRLGTQVWSEVSDDDIYVVSAKGEDGTVGILVTDKHLRYSGLSQSIKPSEENSGGFCFTLSETR